LLKNPHQAENEFLSESGFFFKYCSTRLDKDVTVRRLSDKCFLVWCLKDFFSLETAVANEANREILIAQVQKFLRKSERLVHISLEFHAIEISLPASVAINLFPVDLV